MPHSRDQHASPPRPTLVFDLGGVLYENTGFDELIRLTGGRYSDQDMRRLWLNSPTVHSYETGQLGSDEFASRITRELDLALSPAQFIAEFKTWPKGFYPGARELVTRLKQHYCVGCFSNSNELHWRREFEHLFEFCIASQLTGQAKPCAQAFQYLIDAAAVAPADIYFFDDSQANVDAARQAGITAFLSFGFEQLQRILRQQGIQLD